MSSFFKPKISKPKETVADKLDYVQNRGATGRTILAGSSQDTSSTQKKSILGG